MQQYTTDIMIIGGGASGLAAAVAAKRFCPELSVTILERNSRVGKKILETVAATLGTFQQIPDIITAPVKSTGIQL